MSALVSTSLSAEALTFFSDRQSYSILSAYIDPLESVILGLNTVGVSKC